MNKEQTLLLRRIFDIIYSITIIIAGLCLIAGCFIIYFTGERTYSREVVAETFSKICIPIYICLVLTVISFIFEMISPSAQKKYKNEKAYAHLLDTLSAKKDFTQCSDEVLIYINKERKIRKIMICIRTAVLTVASAIFLIYAFNSNNFDQREVTDSMINAMWVLIPCLVFSFGYAVFAGYYCDKSMLREIDLIKKLPNAQVSQMSKNNNSHLTKIDFVLQIAFLAIAVVILIYGFVSGGTADVLAKATKICTECIGLG